MAIDPEDLPGAAGGGAFATPTPIRPTKPGTHVKRARETRPQKRARLAREAAARAVDDDDDTPAAAKPATATTKRQSGTPGAERARNAARVSQSKWVGGVLAFVGRNAERAGAMEPGSPLVPFGRAMQFNAPIAGATFDDAVRGTAFDKKAQPLLSRGSKFQSFGNAVGFPMLILAMTTKPELWDVLAPAAFEMFEANIESMGPMIAAKVKKDRSTQETIDKAVKEGMLPTFRDPATGGERNPTAQELFEALFAPVPPAAPAGGDDDEAPAPTE